MLDLAAIKSTPRAGDAPSQAEKRPANDRSKNPSEQEFQSAYDTSSEKAQTKPERSEARDNAATETPDSPDRRAASEKAEAENAEISVAGADGPSKLQEVSQKSKGEAAAGLGTDRRSGQISNEKTDRNLVSRTSNVSAAEPQGSSEDAAEGPKKTTPEASEVKKEPARKTPAEAIILSKVAKSTPKNRAEGSADGRVAAVATDAVKSSAVLQPDVGTPKAERKLAALRKDDVQLRDAEMRSPQLKPSAQVATLVPAANAPLIAKTPMQVLSEGLKDKAELTPVVTGDGDTFGSWETRTASPTSSTQMAQILARSETPTMIARQMAEALQRLPDKPVEISLNPRELGRVRMNISAAEAGITVSIVAERPETLDLMRRHIDELTREFQSIGYESIAFAFAEGEENQAYSDPQGEDTQADSSRLEIVEGDEQTLAPSTMSASSGIDIRL